MKITKEWLKGKWACKAGFDWWGKHAEANVKKLALRLVKENHFDWANWMLTRTFDKTQNIKYAIFSAEQVIGIYEKDYPKDDRPRKAIEAAKDYLKKSNASNPANPADAANAAYAAAAANAAAKAAAYAAEIKQEIIDYGLSLIEED